MSRARAPTGPHRLASRATGPARPGQSIVRARRLRPAALRGRTAPAWRLLRAYPPGTHSLPLDSAGPGAAAVAWHRASRSAAGATLAAVLAAAVRLRLALAQPIAPRARRPAAAARARRAAARARAGILRSRIGSSARTASIASRTCSRSSHRYLGARAGAGVLAAAGGASLRAPRLSSETRDLRRSCRCSLMRAQLGFVGRATAPRSARPAAPCRLRTRSNRHLLRVCLPASRPPRSRRPPRGSRRRRSAPLALRAVVLGERRARCRARRAPAPSTPAGGRSPLARGYSSPRSRSISCPSRP